MDITSNTYIFSIVFYVRNVGGDSTRRNVGLLVSHECWAGGQSGMCFNDRPHYCLRYL